MESCLHVTFLAVRPASVGTWTESTEKAPIDQGAETKPAQRAQRSELHSIPHPPCVGRCWPPALAAVGPLHWPLSTLHRLSASALCIGSLHRLSASAPCIGSLHRLPAAAAVGPLHRPLSAPCIGRCRPPASAPCIGLLHRPPASASCIGP